jgi:predicted PurR-regulated permease PerM
VYEDGPRDPYQRRLISIFWVIALAFACVWLLWRISQILLILFAAILGAVFLDGLACFAQRRLGLPHAPAIALIIMALLFIIVGFGFVVGPTLMAQSEQLTDLIPQSLNQLWSWAQAHHWDEILIATKPSRLVPSATDLLGELSGIFSTTIGGLASMLIIIVLAIYLAVSPQLYIDGLIRLLPGRRKDLGREVLAELAHALREWLMGRFVSMFAVAILTAVGLWFIDLPSALALAVLAGLMSFVPYFGPIAATVPALLIALPGWPAVPLWVLLLYTGIQFIEGNLITPLVQRRMVSLPPVTLLVAQITIGFLFGLLGLLLATPLAVVIIVLVQILYIRNVLGDPICVLGEHPDAT